MNGVPLRPWTAWFRRMVVVMVLFGTGALAAGAPALAFGRAEADALARQVEQLLRSAEKDTKAGVLPAAAEKIDRAETLLGKLKAAAPRHRAIRPMTARLATARKHYEEALAAGPSDTSAADSARAAAAGAEADARLMVSIYDTYYPKLDLVHGNSLVYGAKVSDARGALDEIQAAEALLPEFADDLGRLAERYGTEPLEIGNNLHRLGVDIAGDPGGKMSTMIEALAKVAASRKASAVSCAKNAEMFLAAYSEQVTDAYLKRMADAKKILVIGRELDPDNGTVADMLAGVDEKIAAAAEKMETQIDAAVWAGNVKGFPGPGSAGALAAEALAFFRKHPDWGKRPDKKIEVLRACVRGPWQVAKRDIFGRVVCWRLPIHLAVTDAELRGRGIARVYEMSILALEGPGGHAPKAPPFGGYWVGDSWMMRVGKL